MPIHDEPTGRPVFLKEGIKVMKKRVYKVLALSCVAALGLTLTGCYVPPDDLGNSQTLTTGTGAAPFQTVHVTEAPTPTPTIPPATATPAGPTNTVNWDDDQSGGGSSAVTTNVPGATVNPYAQNTIVVLTATPTLIPVATPKPTTAPTAASSLKRGSSGASVKTVQQRLKDLGYYTGSVDGDFGEGTEAAVKAFQKANGLTADGKVGTQTLSKLNSSSAKRASATPKPTAKPTKKPTPKPTKKPTPKPTATPRATAPSYADKTYLQIGMSGSKTRSLQNRLIELGWLAGKADGEYGGATDAAVRAFQKNTPGLWSDGIAGPDTLNALYSSGAARASTPAASIGVTLKKGMDGGSVRALQNRLKSLGYLSGSVDGDFGEATEAAVIAFQKNNGLTADGHAGTTTLNVLYSQTAVRSNGGSASTDTHATAAPSGSSVSSTGYTTLRKGDSGDAVKKLQKALKDKGCYSGATDGSYGSDTVAAVMAFQSLHNLTVDGVAGPATQRVLYNTSGSSITYTSLSEGMSGEAVRTLQYTLYELGYYTGSVDGNYGAATSDAVRAFQYNNDLTPDGKAGNKTLQVLYSSSARSARDDVNPSFSTLRPGDHGEDVLELKDALMQYGYLRSDNGSNYYDSDTEQAVRDFQFRNGLQVDGIAGPDTQTKLFSNNVTPNY